MKKKFITQVGDTDQCFIMLKIGSKNYDTCEPKADQLLNDLLSCVSFTKNNYDFSESPKFEKAIELINNKLWGMIK